MPVMAGELAVTVNALISIPSLPSELVTTTLRVPEGTPVRSNAQLIWFLFTTTTPVAKIAGYEVLFSLTVAKDWKPVPATLVAGTEESCIPEFGVIPVIVSPGVLTVKPFLSTPDCPSVFITVISHNPGDVGAGRDTVQVMFVASSTLTSDAKRSGFPRRDSFTEAPPTKFVPVRFLMLTKLPLVPEFGVILVTAGAGPAGKTIKPLERIPGTLPGFVTMTSHWPVAAPFRLILQVT